jgi:ATP-dependent exoDNAse (exonuclease V) beta subunit
MNAAAVSAAGAEPPAAASIDYAAIGTATHLLLSQLDPAATDYTQWADVSRLEAMRDALLKLKRIDAASAAALKLEPIAQMVAKLDPLLRGILGQPGGAVLRELPVAMLVEAAEVQAQMAAEAAQAAIAAPGPAEPEALESQARSHGLGLPAVYVQGALDLLVYNDREALVLDYKTDRGASAEQLIARYRRQLEWYARAARALLPGREVRWAIYGLGGAGLVSL